MGPALFFSLLIITLSFIPVFALQAQAGRLFKPLAFTKTVCMAAAALLSTTLTPALMSYLMRRGSGQPHGGGDECNLLDRVIQAIYRPVLRWTMANRTAVGILFVALLVSTVIPWSRIGMEFLPFVFEGERLTPEEIDAGVQSAAVDRMRPRVMVLALLTLGLLPIFWGEGSGASLMRIIAAPVVGGMISTVTVIFLLLPPVYAWWRAYGWPGAPRIVPTRAYPSKDERFAGDQIFAGVPGGRGAAAGPDGG